MSKKVIDPEPIIRKLAERCLKAKGVECSILGEMIDMLRAAPNISQCKEQDAICRHCDKDVFCDLYSNDAVVWKCNRSNGCKDYAKVAVDEDNE